jgi:hypothetical protein
MANSRPKRPKAPPPSLNLEEMEHDPSMRGMLSFLEISPAEKLEMLRRRAHVEITENKGHTTVVDEPQTTVALVPTDPVSDLPATTVSEHPASTVAFELPATVSARPANTVVAGTRRPASLLWCAEGNAGVFPDSRVRQIVHARDVLTRTEQAVYDVLWGPAEPDDRERLASGGYDVVARQAGVTKMNAKRIIERLIDKGFLMVEALPDTLRRIPTRYRIFSYTAALEHMVGCRRSHVVRTGNGILFAHRLPATVVAGISATVSTVPTEMVSADTEETVAGG